MKETKAKMWDVLAKAGTGTTLAALSVALVAGVYRLWILKDIKKIKLAPKNQRARLIEAMLESYRVDTSKLKEIQYEVLIRLIKERAARAKRLTIVGIIIALLAAVITAFAMWQERKPPPTPIACLGKLPAGGTSFSISDNYAPSGYMGDIKDIVVEQLDGTTRFTYETTGKGTHEWDYTYVGGEINNEPAGFGGVMYLNPPNNWGRQPGYDLRDFRRTLKWEARSLTGAVQVVFVIGGIDWEWDHIKKEQNYKLRCPDSMPRKATTKTLNEQWQSFDMELSNLPPEYFSSVVGGFAWLIEWGSNGVTFNKKRDGSETTKKFIIEIRNIRYER